jgi:hypothetical protein
MFALYTWQQTGKPPLLGPQTSALPFNQSALYFYLLYPLFLLTNQSLFSTIYTTILFYLVFLGLAVFLLKKDKFWLRIVTVILFLFAIHPQFILQNRYVWNPSFVPPLVIFSFLVFQFVSKKFSPILIFVFSLSIATATAFTYSAAPFLVAFLILSLIRIPKKSVLLVLSLVVSLMIVNLPTIYFELRHNFVLTNLLLTSPKLPQSENSPIEKLGKLYQYLVMPSSKIVGLTLVLIFIAAIWYGFRYYQKIKQQQLKIFKDALFLFIVTALITLFVPVSLHAHYVLVILSLAIIIIALLPNKVLIPVLIIFGAFWLRPKQVSRYFKPAHRTAAESVACAQKVCQQEKKPFFVSVQAGFHPYHAGPEFRYLFSSNGCKIAEIEKNPKAANLMAVVADRSTYEHGKTKYHELEMFGESKEVRVYQCKDNFKVHILSR